MREYNRNAADVRHARGTERGKQPSLSAPNHPTGTAVNLQDNENERLTASPAVA